VSIERKFLARLDDLKIEVDAKSHMQARQMVAREYKKRKPAVDLPMAYLVACAESKLVDKEDRKVFRLESNNGDTSD